MKIINYTKEKKLIQNAASFLGSSLEDPSSVALNVPLEEYDLSPQSRFSEALAMAKKGSVVPWRMARKLVAGRMAGQLLGSMAGSRLV